MNRLTRLAAGCVLAAAATLAMGAPASEAAVVEALRLPALAERIAKLHAQLGQGVVAARSRRALDEALREFDASLRAAAARAASPEARESYLLLSILWEEYRVWARKPPTRENVRKLAERADEVAWVAAKAARQVDRQGARPLAAQAARICVLSQRVPRLHMLRRIEGRNDELVRELVAASDELRRALERLAATPGNTPEIAGEIQVAETQHGFLARAGRELERTGAAAPHVENIAKTGDHILESMTRVLRLYAAAGL